jgi:hypothetical protein
MAYRWAYDFTCDQPIDTILAAFNGAGPWQWQMHDSVIFGDYLSCRPRVGLWVRVHEYSQLGNRPMPLFASEHFRASAGRRDKGFAAALQIDGERSTRPAIDRVFQRLLKGIGATDVTEIEPYD